MLIFVKYRLGVGLIYIFENVMVELLNNIYLN